MVPLGRLGKENRPTMSRAVYLGLALVRRVYQSVLTIRNCSRLFQKLRICNPSLRISCFFPFLSVRFLNSRSCWIAFIAMTRLRIKNAFCRLGLLKDCVDTVPRPTAKLSWSSGPAMSIVIAPHRPIFFKWSGATTTSPENGSRLT